VHGRAPVGAPRVQAEAAAWNVGRIPDNFSFGEIAPDWARMSPYLEKAMSRVPATLKVTRLGQRSNVVPVPLVVV
jgi:hypothetical protein